MTAGRVRNIITQFAEKKFFDNNDNYSLVTGSPITTKLTSIIQGSTVNQRIGDKILINSIEVNVSYTIVASVSTLAPQNFWTRLTLLIWKDDSSPTSTSVYQQTTVTGTDCIHNSPLRHDLKIKRKILYDKVDRHTCLVNLATLIRPGSINFPIQRRIFIPFKNMPMSLRTLNYQQGSVTGVNNIFMIESLEDDSALGIPELAAQHCIRINFCDV